MEFPSRLFITGIGTDVGKSYATGWLAKDISGTGFKVITQKLIQTGNQCMSEDIELHRRIMGIGLLEEDLDHTTAPEIYSYPCSPDLAADIDRRHVNFAKIDAATDELARRFDTVLIEGAGGIMVPLTEDYLTIDYIRDRDLPVVFVTNGRLGSVSDTLLGLEAVRQRGLRLFALAYNHHFDYDHIVTDHTQEYLKKRLRHDFPDAIWIDIPAEL